MAATVSAWGKPGAWALDAEENESELLRQSKEHSSASDGAEPADFPSLAAAKTKKKKAQPLSLQEFSAYTAGKPAKGLTHDEQLALPTGPRERTAEELDRNKLGGGFRSYGGGGGSRDERQGGYNRESSREFTPSRADETDDWGAGKKSSGSNAFERRERGERGGFFGDTQSRADEADNWGSNKSFAPSEPRKYEKRGSFGSESSNWGKSKEEEGRRSGGAFDSLRERRGGVESDSDTWGRKTEESSGGNRPRLNLQPRTLPVKEEPKNEDAIAVVKPKGSNPYGEARPRDLQPRTLPVKEESKNEDAIAVVKPKGSNPFGEARPREEVLKEKGQDVKEIEDKLEHVKVKEVVSAGAGSVWSGRDKTEKPWRRPEMVDPPPPQSSSAGETENGNAEDGEGKDSQI